MRSGKITRLEAIRRQSCPPSIAIVVTNFLLSTGYPSVGLSTLKERCSNAAAALEVSLSNHRFTKMPTPLYAGVQCVLN